MISYNEFIDLVETISEGDNEEVVRKRLGNPSSISGSNWVYTTADMKGYPGVPPPTGLTVFPMITLEFKNDKVKNVSKSWIDSTGPKL